MSRRRKRKGNGGKGFKSSPLAPTPNLGTNVHPKTTDSPLLTDAFKGAVEKVADWPRKDFASEVKRKPMVFFVHEDGTMKAVSLSFTDEYQKESLIRKIREKARAERAFAVIFKTEMDAEKHTVVLSGVSPGIKISVCVDYSFDPESKTITSRTINWLNQSVQNTLIDEIFDTTPRRT